jgi:PKD repeat protein
MRERNRDGSDLLYKSYNPIYFVVNQQLVLITLLVFFFHGAQAQISVTGIPESYSLKTKNAVVIPSIQLNAINISDLLGEDKKSGIPNRYGVVQQIDIDIKAEGFRTEIAGKGYIWQYEVHSLQCYSLGITFGKFLLPEGSTLFIYDKDRSGLTGAFTSLNNNSNNQLTIADFDGQNAIIEYFEPFNPPFPGQLAICSVSQAYRIPLKAAAVTRIGINCPEGTIWQDAKHSVCLMTYHDSRYTYDCSGFLVNNVRKDGTPYFQTANHCISTSSMAATLITYFNYENSTCTTTDAPKKQTLSGATLKATNSYSDFTLLLLNEYPPVLYLPFYAGWDASARNPLKGTNIHHPQGTAKCIALDNNPPISYAKSSTWLDGGVVVSTSAANSHWEVQFDAGENESGSSGSPLFDDNKRVIGQLHGGSTGYDLFGKFSHSWDHGTTSSTQLKYWLDPDNTGTLTLDGAYNTIKPKSSFSTTLTRICPGAVIKLTDNSLYNPTNWSWDIQPSTCTFANGTTKNSQNPEIIFNNAGIYTVSQTVSNANGSDNLTKTNYINTGNLIVKLSGLIKDSIICGCDLINFPLSASGATNYTFKSERPDKISYTSKLDSVFLSLIPAEKKNGSFNSWIKVVGTQGTCSTSDSVELKISMPKNDDVENAIRLNPGRNTAYSNVCSSLQTGEVSPSSSVMKNTIWFTFQAPSSGMITIDTHGFNDQLALYDASSYSNLISSNSSYYKLLASNDNRSLSDNTSMIKTLTVEPYKKYWLQVGGSAGETGSCIIDLLSNSLEVYPNPSSGNLNIIISNNEDGNAEVKVVSFLGQTLYSENISVTKEKNSFSFNLSPFTSGIYFIVVTINGMTMQKKLLLKK